MDITLPKPTPADFLPEPGVLDAIQCLLCAISEASIRTDIGLLDDMTLHFQQALSYLKKHASLMVEVRDLRKQVDGY